MPSPSDTGASRVKFFRTVDTSMPMGAPRCQIRHGSHGSFDAGDRRGLDEGSGEVSQGRHELAVDDAIIS